MTLPTPASLRRVAAAIVLSAGFAPHASATAERSEPGKPATQKPSPATPVRPAVAPVPSTLEVTVLDAAGRPVQGALVLAYASVGAFTPSGQMSSERRRSALTGSDGRARLEPMPRPPWNVSVSARGHVARGEARVGVGKLTIRLERGGTISGVVLDGDSKAPVPGARVSREAGLPPPSDWEEQAARDESVTDAKGSFRLDGIGRGPVTLVARATGYGPGRREGVRAGSRSELFLFPGSTLTGTVRDEAGRPVKGATVRLQGDGWLTPAPAETTDARGAFTVAGVEPGEYVVVAREGARAAAIDTVIVPPRSEASVELTLGAGGFASGRVVDGAGKALAGARVRVLSFEDRGLPPFVGDSLAGESAADGTFAIGPLPAGRLGLSVSLVRHAPRRLEVAVASRQSVDLGEVVLVPGLAIRGRVRDRDRNGVAGALVHAQLGDAGSGTGAESSSAETESESDGSFLIAGLKPGTHEVTASTAGLVSARGRAEAGGEPIMLVMEAGGTITGRVVDAKGEPVDGAMIIAQSATLSPGDPAMRWLSGTSGGVEGEGRFVLRDAAADTYSLRVRATGYGEGSLANVKVVAGRQTDVGPVTLGGGGSVVGSVVDADGQGVPGATVLVERDSNVHTGDLTAQTDSAGAFEVRGVPPGRVDVIARHPAYVPGRLRGVDVDPEKEPSPVRVVLTRGGRVEGRARHRDGSPFVGGRVQVYPARGGLPGGLDLAPTGADGSFVLEHVPAGTMSVNLMTFVPSHPSVGGSPGLTILGGVATREAEVREGETTAVDIATREVVVAGRLTRGGQGAAGVRVSVMTADTGSVMSMMGPNAPRAGAPPQGPPPLSDVTREDGSYELLVFGPGRAWVSMRAEASRQSYAGRDVSIPDVERYDLDLDLGETTVSGTVVDRETGVPVPEASVGLRQPGPEGQWKGGAGVSRDGRFAIGADAGEYLLEARAPGRRLASTPVSVGAGGLADVRVEMDRGLEIAGRLLDAAGRPVSGLGVVASDSEGRRSGAGQYANTQPDGSFRLSGLEAKPYVVASGSQLNGFAIRAGVVPGEEPITLALRPAGLVLLRVVGPDGQPVKDVFPHVRTWEGLRVDVPGAQSTATDTIGVYELSAPAGTVGLQVGWDKAYGTATVTVRTGETTRLDLTLKELPPR